jgi:hypothetical protein
MDGKQTWDLLHNVVWLSLGGRRGPSSRAWLTCTKSVPHPLWAQHCLSWSVTLAVRIEIVSFKGDWNKRKLAVLSSSGGGSAPRSGTTQDVQYLCQSRPSPFLRWAKTTPKAQNTPSLTPQAPIGARKTSQANPGLLWGRALALTCTTPSRTVLRGPFVRWPSFHRTEIPLRQPARRCGRRPGPWPQSPLLRRNLAGLPNPSPRRR